ncbi:hypothetical protein RND71_040473 [Anisodus tanguticus]|uniref:Reverse transcriptase Ty1/copia-type domain-containing protein n=1 Tax=Anisodus tanguticus TaxID=243964 RepID=A0AAE1UTE0_9SOLA|nr:hypothetical protein RND71_040473 [Anisodus tanguticus]
MHTLGLNPPDANWYMDTGATSHMMSSQVINRHVIFDESQFPFAKVNTPVPSSYNFLDDSISPYIIHYFSDVNSPRVSSFESRLGPAGPLPAGQSSPSPANSQNSPNSSSNHRPVTRSQRGVFTPKRHFNLYSNVSKSPLPRNPVSALNDPNWKIAMTDEYNALIDNKTWELVLRPSGINIIMSMWIFAHKENSDGSFARHKVRLVGDGKTQQVGIDCDDIILTASSDAIRQSIMTMLSSEFAMKDLGPLSYFLGIAVNRHSDRLFLSQRNYAAEIIERAGMSSC